MLHAHQCRCYGNSGNIVAAASSGMVYLDHNIAALGQARKACFHDNPNSIKHTMANGQTSTAATL